MTGRSPSDVRRAPTEQPQRKITTPLDLRVGDEVFVYSYEWHRAKITKVIPAFDRSGLKSGEGTTPRYVMVKIVGGKEVRRVDHEVIPFRFVSSDGSPKPTIRRASAIKWASDLWDIARDIQGVTI